MIIEDKLAQPSAPTILRRKSKRHFTVPVLIALVLLTILVITWGLRTVGTGS
jgi:hypothetical protein